MGKDANRIRVIIKYCEKIEDAIEEFGKKEEEFFENQFYHDVCSFYLSQIGENSGFLSPELKRRYSEVNWSDMTETRNTIAHGYDGMDLEIIWSSINKKIPSLKKTCEGILKDMKRP